MLFGKRKILRQDGNLWVVFLFLLILNEVSRKRLFVIDIKSERIDVRVIPVGKEIWIATMYLQILINPHI